MPERDFGRDWRTPVVQMGLGPMKSGDHVDGVLCAPEAGEPGLGTWPALSLPKARLTWGTDSMGMYQVAWMSK